jgi:hypothetical protein
VPYAGAIRAQGRTPAEVQAALRIAPWNQGRRNAGGPAGVFDHRAWRWGWITPLPRKCERRAHPRHDCTRGGLDRPVTTFGSCWSATAVARPSLSERPFMSRKIIFMCVRGIQFSSIPSRKHSWHLALPVHKQRRREAITDSSLSGAWRLSIAEGIGRAGGLADAQADPASIFLYRGETREVAQLLGIDCRPYPGPIIPGYLQSQLAGSRRLFLGIKVRDEE